MIIAMVKEVMKGVVPVVFSGYIDEFNELMLYVYLIVVVLLVSVSVLEMGLGLWDKKT